MGSLFDTDPEFYEACREGPPYPTFWCRDHNRPRYRCDELRAQGKSDDDDEEELA